MSKLHMSEITLKVALDENRVPEKADLDALEDAIEDIP